MTKDREINILHWIIIALLTATVYLGHENTVAQRELAFYDAYLTETCKKSLDP